MAAFFDLLKSAATRAFNPGLGFASGGTRVPAQEVALPIPPRPRVGLALSSGAAKGLAHVGVIQVLEENGIEIDAVAGTSMGAYVGSLYAAGLTGQELGALAAEISTSQDLAKLVDPCFPPRRGFIYGKRIVERLRQTLGDRKIEDLPKVLRIVATELHSFRERVFSQGDVVDAVWASSAIPGICVPVELNGVEYVDGAVGNPLPVNLVREHVDIVIAVSVLPTLEELADGEADPQALPQMPLSIWRAAGLWLNRNLNYFARGNLLDILRQAAYGSQIRLLERSAAEADILIRASVRGSNWHDYHHAPEYIARGRAAALEMIPAIKARIAAFQPEVRRCA
jgi:NTE family protein